MRRSSGRSHRYIDPRYPAIDGGEREAYFGDEFVAVGSAEKCRVSWCPFVGVRDVEGWLVCHWHGHLLARTRPLDSAAAPSEN